MKATPGKPSPQGWRDVRRDLLVRIRSGEWQAGDTIPGEVRLAEELGCARATVNRALRDLAGMGLVERKRRAGTTVVATPTVRAVFMIPIVRNTVEDAGGRYTHRILSCERRVPDGEAAAALGSDEQLRVCTLHLGDGRPFALEQRWVHLAALPQVEGLDLSAMSLNEWLVRHVPYTSGTMAISAEAAGPDEALALDVDLGTPVLVQSRTTFDQSTALTVVRLTHAPGYRLDTVI